MSMSNCPTVSIIVLNYNGLSHLKDCFSSLTKLDYPNEQLELVLVDNASKDGSVEFIQANYPQVRVICNEENLGFGAGNNCGAREVTSKYVIFLNNDMWVDSQFVRELVKAVQSEPEAVSAGAKILNWDGSEFDFAGSASHFAGFAYQEGIGNPFSSDQFSQMKPMLFACGGAMLVDREVFLEVGGFDGDYFLFYEDSDLGWRLWLMGHKVVFAPDAIAYHRHHGSTSKLSDYRKQVLYKRNALYSVIKNYDDENLGRVLPAVLLGTVTGVVSQGFRNQQIDKDDYYIKSQTKPSTSPICLDKMNVSTLVAVQEVVENLPQIMEKRRFVQSRRGRTDKQVAPLFQWPFLFWPDVDAWTQFSVVNAFNLQDLFKDSPQEVDPDTELAPIGSREELEELQAQIRSMNNSKFWQLRQAWLHLRRSLGFGKNQVELVDQLQPYLQFNQLEPETLSQIISAMESSKFWKLRKVWLQIKQTVGLGKNQ